MAVTPATQAIPKGIAAHVTRVCLYCTPHLRAVKCVFVLNHHHPLLFQYNPARFQPPPASSLSTPPNLGWLCRCCSPPLCLTHQVRPQQCQETQTHTCRPTFRLCLAPPCQHCLIPLCHPQYPCRLTCCCLLQSHIPILTLYLSPFTLCTLSLTAAMQPPFP
jgi:hypothetical protein